MKTAYLFPGQGAQVVGMGKDIAEKYPSAMEVFSRANEIVGYDLKQLCFEGPAEKLNTTTISQPAIFTVSAAILEVVGGYLESIGHEADVTAGLSLGEYTALYAGGVLSFEDGLRLVSKRGEAMQAAADKTDGTMVSILGLDEEQVGELCKEAGENELLVASNFNCPGQIVISGVKAACGRAEELAEKYGAIKAIRLQVAGAFHSDFMTSAADSLGEAIGQSNVGEPSKIKIIANINAEFYQSGEKIAEGLIKQLTCPILWQKCMERLLEEGVEKFYEIGPGRVLTGLMRKVNRKTKVENLSNLDAVNKLLSNKD